MNLHKRPLFLIGIAYIGGIVCAPQPNAHPVYGVLAALCILALGCLVSRRTIARPVIGMLAAVFAIGFIRTALCRQVPVGDVSRYAEGKMVYITGTVASDVEPVGDGARFVVGAARVKTYGGEFPATGSVMTNLRRSQYTEEEARVPVYGEVVRIHGRLSLPQSASNPGGFDYGQYLARKGIFCALTSYGNEVTILHPSALTLRAVALRFKSALTAECSKLFAPTNGALLLGILIGDYSSLPLDVQSAFMRSGTMHLLAASGYNCAIIAMIFGFLLHRLTVPRSVTYCILIALVWAFALMVGMCPSIVRASVMVTVFMAAYLFWRAPDMYNIMCAAVLVILAANPLCLYDIGFLLSFVAVFAIVSTMPLIDPCIRGWLMRTPRVWEKPLSRTNRFVTGLSQDITLTIVLSAVAGMWTWPITAYYFNYLSLVSVVANALVALLVVLLTAFGIASLVCGWIWLPLGRVVAAVTTGITTAMLRIVTGLGTHPWSSLSVRSPNPMLIAIYYVVLLGGLEYAHRKASRTQGIARADCARTDRDLDLVPGAQK